MDVFKKNKELIKEIHNKTRFKRVFYIIEYDNGCKVGVTTQLNRLRVYVSPWCRPILSITLSHSPNAILHENMCKKQFKCVATNSTEFLDTNSQEIVAYLDIEKTITQLDMVINA